MTIFYNISYLIVIIIILLRIMKKNPVKWDFPYGVWKLYKYYNLYVYMYMYTLIIMVWGINILYILGGSHKYIKYGIGMCIFMIYGGVYVFLYVKTTQIP